MDYQVCFVRDYNIRLYDMPELHALSWFVVIWHFFIYSLEIVLYNIIVNIKYNDYLIEIINETDYSSSSNKNSSHYEKNFVAGNQSDYSTKYGIKIKNSSDELINSCLLVGATGSGTSPDEKSYLIEDDTLFICISNLVFSLSLIELNLNWYKEVDFATAFGIYKMNDDFIIHGELYITRLNKKGEIIWQKSGSDIFVSPSSANFPTDNFYIKDNMIFAKSWDERKYQILYDGEIIQSL